MRLSEEKRYHLSPKSEMLKHSIETKLQNKSDERVPLLNKRNIAQKIDTEKIYQSHIFIRQNQLRK